jgi:hypothetical protein
MRYTTLALTLIDGVRPNAAAADRAAAADAQRQLSAFVTDAARRVHQRYAYLRPQRADDFVREVPGHMTVVLLEKFAAFHAALADDAGRSDDPAAGFLYTAVSNHYVSLARRRTAVQLTDANRAGEPCDGGTADPFDRMAADNRRPAPADAIGSIDAADFWAAPLPAVDRRTIDRWRPLDAVVLLVLSGLHTKVAAADWRRWVAACGARGPVPSAATLALPDGSRRDGLARDLGITRNGLDQIWSRKRRWLAELTFVRRVRQDHPGRDAA